jgi:hypothetical protein
LVNKHASYALQGNTARLKGSQLRVETVLWELFPPAVPIMPTALRVYQANTATLLAYRCHLAIVRLDHFPAVAPKQHRALLVFQAPPMHSSELQSAPLAHPGISRTKRVRTHACSATQVRTAAAKALLLLAAAALQERSPPAVPALQRARHAPQASTAQRQV